MADEEDTVAQGVAADFAYLAQHRAMQLCGYVRLTEIAVQKRVDDKLVVPEEYELVPAMRVYTTTAFDSWVEIPSREVLYKLQETEGRSLLWINADTPVTRCQSVAAVGLAQALVSSGSGGDDPTSFPPRPRG